MMNLTQEQKGQSGMEDLPLGYEEFCLETDDFGEFVGSGPFVRYFLGFGGL